MKHALTVLAATLVLATPANAQAPPECPWMDTTRSATARAEALLAASSLDQKLRWLDEQSANNPAQTVFNIGGGQTTTMPPQVPCTPVIQYTDAPSAIVRRRHGRHGLPGPGRPQRHVGRGARPPQGEGAGLRGVPQAPQRDPGPGSRQRPHAAQRPHAGVPRRGSAARRHAGRGDGPRLPRQPGRAGRVGPQALRRQRAGARPPVELVERRPAHAAPDLHAAVRGGDPEEPARRRHVPVQPGQRRLRAARTRTSCGRSSRTRSASTAGSSPTSARVTR